MFMHQIKKTTAPRSSYWRGQVVLLVVGRSIWLATDSSEYRIEEEKEDGSFVEVRLQRLLISSARRSSFLCVVRDENPVLGR